MSLKVQEVFKGVRALLNDQDNAVYTDTVQLEYIKMAYEEIRQTCEEYSIPLNLKTSEVINIPQGTTNIGGPNGPPLPKDLVDPLECWEISAGTNDDYMLMRRLDFLPKTSVLTAFLEVWVWQGQYIQFLGANGDIDVKLDYICVGMPDIVDENTIVKLTNAVNFLKYRTAAFIAMFVQENETRAAVLNDLSDTARDTLLNIKIKAQQNVGTRRRPFMASYKARRGTGGR